MTEKTYNEIINLTPHENANEDYEMSLIHALDKYYHIIIKEFGKTDALVTEVKSYIDKIIEIANDSYTGSPSKAYEKLSKLMDIYGDCIYYEDTIGKDYYRMRVFEYRRSGISYNEMFHIPLNMRREVQTQRYSAPGYPCLYMGLSVYGCWEEMGRPRMSDCWASRIHCTAPMKLLDLRVPTFKTLGNKDGLDKYVKLFPLIISCMMKPPALQDRQYYTYKPEYIIPQLIMEWIISTKKTDGVIYTSVMKGEDFNYPKEKRDNVAIPVKKLSDKYKYCLDLAKIFTITDPLNNEIENLKHPDIDAGSNDNEKQETKEEKKYNKSDFGGLEKYLMDSAPKMICDDEKKLDEKKLFLKNSYLPQLKDLFNLLDFKNYCQWTFRWGWYYFIKIKQHEDVCYSKEHINKIGREDGFVEINSLLENLSLFLHDYLYVCDNLIEFYGKNDYHIRKGYDGKTPYSQQYEKKKEYDEKCFLIQDLLLELTRLLNFLLERIRNYEPEFLDGHDIMTISDFNRFGVIYQDQEKTLSPYPGLEEFVEKTRFTRSWHVGHIRDIKKFNFSPIGK